MYTNGTNDRTVLVLGAGASKDYGFPLGRELRDDVCQVCRSHTPTLCRITGFTAEQFVEFGQRLERSGYTSVDWYLEMNPDDMPIGRKAIAAALTHYEQPTKLFPGPADHWYETVFNRWWADDEKTLARGRRVTILTFNYDRSLELYLSTVVGTRTGQVPSDAIVRIKGADHVVVADGPEIIHLHGQLRGEYSNTWTTERLDDEGLLLLSSADHGSAEFERGRAAISRCRSLYFLGFGFNPKSMNRLGDFTDASVVSGIEISGTHVGVIGRAWDNIKRDYLPSWVESHFHGESVCQFVRENLV